MTRNTDEREHSKDVFEIGDRVPWFGDYAIVIARSVREEIPDSVEEVNYPRDYTEVEMEDDVNYVILALDLPDKASNNEAVVPATWLFENTNARFNESGLPTVKADKPLGMNSNEKVEVQTPATGNNAIEGSEARELANFLREHSDFEPLYALLGRVSNRRDMLDVANALDRAATATEIHKRAEE